MPPHELPNLLRLKAEKGTNRRGQAEKFCQVDPVGSGGKLEVAAERTVLYCTLVLWLKAEKGTNRRGQALPSRKVLFFVRSIL